MREKVEMRSDYFVYCMTHAAAHRLFDDFGYDACVAITRPREFLQRLIAAVKTALPDWHVGSGRVKYEDPHFVSARDLRIPMTKHFRYAYQREYRVFWVPQEPRKNLNPFFVELGSIEDCASLIILPPKVVTMADEAPMPSGPPPPPVELDAGIVTESGRPSVTR